MTNLANIRAIALDVDGVLTDGTVAIGMNDQEFKRLNFHDIMGVSLGKKAGLRFVLISGEDAGWAASKLGADVAFAGHCNHKSAYLDLCCVPLDQIAYIGDDVNDIPAMELAGVKAAPADAHESVWCVPGIIELSRSGGHGAVREFIDMVLEAKLTKSQG